MRTIALALAALLYVPVAQAQASVDIRFNLPAVLPPMVVVQPGVQVVPEVQEEVFFHDNWYWVRRRDGRWYRSVDYRNGWVLVPPRRVPPTLVAIPPGRYRNWKAAKEEEKRERREAKREWKEEKRREKEERHHDHGHGHGHGHDD